MGRNSCGVRMGMQKLVKVKGESSPVSSHLGSFTYKSSKTVVFIEAFNAFIQSDFQQSDHVREDNVL